MMVMMMLLGMVLLIFETQILTGNAVLQMQKYVLVVAFAVLLFRRFSNFIQSSCKISLFYY